MSDVCPQCPPGRVVRWYRHACRKGDGNVYWNGSAKCPACGSHDVVEEVYEPITYDPSDGSAKGVRG